MNDEYENGVSKTENTETDTETENNTETENTENTESVAETAEPVADENAVRYADVPAYSETVYAHDEKPVKKKHHSFWIAATAVLLVLCLVSTSFAVGMAFGGDKSTVKGGGYTIMTASTPGYTYTEQKTSDDILDVPGVIAKVNPSVVDIYTTTSEGAGLASGFIFTEDGYIITAAHVVDDATDVEIYLYGDEKTAYPAEIIGFDTYTDIGVLKIEATGLTVAEIGESSKLVAGERVVSIGTPFDISLSHTATEGIVSAQRDSFNIASLGMTLDLIQHTATINPGNSGGPLVNMYGQVVGINSVKIMGDAFSGTTYEDIGFAVQMESALPIIEQIMNNGKVSRPQIGIKGGTDTTIGGVYVAEITKGGSAENADVKVGDIITKLDGVRVKSVEELITMLGKYKIGDVVEITILRDVDVVKTNITLMAPVEEE